MFYIKGITDKKNVLNITETDPKHNRQKNVFCKLRNNIKHASNFFFSNPICYINFLKNNVMKSLIFFLAKNEESDLIVNFFYLWKLFLDCYAREF